MNSSKLRLIQVMFFLALTFDSSLLSKHNYYRQSSIPYIAGDSFRALADHVFDETNGVLNPSSVRLGDIIFVKTDFLDHFFAVIHPAIQNKYLLITHNSDHEVPGKFASFLDDEKLYVWFGMSPTIGYHKKFVPVPIGIANEYWQHGDTDTFSSVLKKSKIGRDRNILLGMNFGVPENLPERVLLYNYFNTKSFCSNIGSADHAQYLTNMANAKFVICPAGNSLDCHRTWEALLMGCIPVMLSSNMDQLLEGLPVLIIKDWHEVTEEFLQDHYRRIKSKFFNYEKIFFFYWMKKIEWYKNQLLTKDVRV